MRVALNEPVLSKLNRQYLPSMSPTYDLVMTGEPLMPAAVGSAWIAFLRPFATSPTARQPCPVEGVVGQVLTSLPMSAPVATLSRYSAFPALTGEAPPRFGSDSS